MASEAPQGERVEGLPAPREILAHIHLELVELGRCADDLQTTISAIVSRLQAPLAQDAQIRLQAADALSQRLDRLAHLVGALEVEIPQSWIFDKAFEPGSDLNLAMRRLGGAEGAATGRTLDGECEFF